VRCCLALYCRTTSRTTVQRAHSATQWSLSSHLTVHSPSIPSHTAMSLSLSSSSRFSFLILSFRSAFIALTHTSQPQRQLRQVRDSQAGFSLVISPENPAPSTSDCTTSSPVQNASASPSSAASHASETTAPTGRSRTGDSVVTHEHSQASCAGDTREKAMSAGDTREKERRFLSVIRVDGCHYNVMTIGGRALLTKDEVTASAALRDFSLQHH